VYGSDDVVSFVLLKLSEHSLALSNSDLKAEPGFWFQIAWRFFDQSEDNGDTKGAAIEGQFWLMAADFFRQFTHALRRDIGRIADHHIDLMPEILFIKGRKEIPNTKLDGRSKIDMVRVLVGKRHGFF
jgi:hypothetical protein